MHFKLDENIPTKVKTFLKSVGHQASTAFEENLSGKKDKELIDVCNKEKFIFITLDNDFSNIVAYPIGNHHGIIVVRSKSQGADSIIGLFKKIMAIVDIKIAEKSIIILDKYSIKLRRGL